MDYTDRLLREDANGLCTLTLNRPEKLNALDRRSFAALDAAIDDLEREADKVGCVVLRAEGKAFCAGADLSAISAGELPRDYCATVLTRLGELQVPTIAAVRGVCMTGGLELALACDLIVADPTARFADTHGKWGLVGVWGMTERLPQRIGVKAAQHMTFTARQVEAEEAKALGLVDIVSGEGGLEDAVEHLAASILANSWFSNAAHKRIIRETSALPLYAALERAQEIFPGRAPDFQERIASFSKR